MTSTSRTLTVAASALTAVAVLANPAAAAAAGLPADVDFYAMPTGGYSVLAQCSFVVGHSTDPRYITWTIQAQATSAGPSVPVATSVQCTVYDSLDRSTTYGGASRALPGPVVVAVGHATVPVGRVPAVCVTGGATFFDGTTISSQKPCP